jgi:predicted ATPase/DNA-binding SARP family transcriptional activator
MRFAVLGPLEVEGDAGEAVAIPGRRPRALLTALLLDPGAVVPLDRLVGALWEDEPPGAPANALQQVVARLRGRLASAGAGGAAALATAPGGYRLSVPPDDVDAERFERGYRLARELREVDPASAAAVLDEALALWRGPAYAEHAEGFARAPAVRLEELRLAALEDRAELHLRLGEMIEAVAALRNLRAAHPFRDRAMELLMRALHASGRTPEALAVYRSHRERLADEMGLDPPLVLRDLESSILRDDIPVPRPRPVTPGLRTVKALPRPPGPLIGRDEDLQLLGRCLARERVLTLVGPGGVGKTALALAAAHQAAASGRRLWWADLTAVTPDRLYDALAEATGVDMPGAAEPVTTLARSMRHLDGVLCLDNAETVLADLATAMEHVVADAPDLAILATSRERLGVAQEHVHLVAPLGLPSGSDPGPAVELFLARAVAIEPGALDQAGLAEVVELCRRLDGMPLAIELAAARAPALGIREFTEQVGTEIDLLAGGRRTVGRHQTMRAVVDASYRLLTDSEAALFERLSVFPDNFRLADVRAVCTDEAMVATVAGELLARLVEQSLVQAGDGRFRLLDTLRTYAAERLSPDGRRALAARHARHVADRVAELSWIDRPDAEAACVAELATMTADLHQAWEHAVRENRALAVELAGLMYDYAYPRQRRDLLEWGRLVADWDIDHPMLPLARATAVSAAWIAGDFEEAERIAAKAADAEDGSPVWARLVRQWGNLAMFAGQTEPALRRFRRAAELSRTGRQPVAEVMTEICVCQAMAYSGREEEARRLLPELRERASRTGNPSAVAWAHYVTGEATGESDVVGALAAYERACRAAREVDHRLFANLATTGSVALMARLGPIEEAPLRLEQAMSEWEEIGNVAAQWWLLLHVAMYLERVGHDREALELFAAVDAGGQRTFRLMGEVERVRACRERILARHGDAFVEAGRAAGAALGLDAAAAVARAALRGVGDGLEGPDPAVGSGPPASTEERRTTLTP